MVPANNTTLEREMLGWLPPGSACTTVKIPRGDGLLTPETLPAYKGHALRLATTLIDRNVDVVAYGCTAAGFIAGPSADNALASDLHRVTSRPVVTTARSMVLGLQEIGARRIALVTPYAEAVNDRLKEFLADGGISVTSFASFYAENTDALGRIQAGDVAELAQRTMTRNCDSMFIACAQLPTFEVLEKLQAEFERPVLSSNRSIFSRVMRAAVYALNE
jgi:maleate cis-trans isomerase